MNLLALETSNDACSVALSSPQGIVESFAVTPRLHAEKLLPMIDDLLRENGVDKKQLNAIAFGCGPGAFIGVRIAASVTQGLALALGIPVVSVSSLAAMAQAYREQADFIVVANDARMNEVYFACYRNQPNGVVSAVIADAVVKPGELDLSALDPSRCVAIGSGWEAYDSALRQRYAHFVFVPNVYPHAAQVAELALYQWSMGQGMSPAQAQPVYLRDSVIQSDR